MKRRFFIAAAGGAICVAQPLLALAQDRTQHPQIEGSVETPDSSKSIWYCGSAVVWLNLSSGTYHYSDDRWYGRTKHGAYACEKEAIAGGHRASLKSSRRV